MKIYMISDTFTLKRKFLKRYSLNFKQMEKYYIKNIVVKVNEKGNFIIMKKI